MIHFAMVTGLQALVTFAFYVAVLVFVMTRRTRLGPQAARLATAGAGLLLAGWLFSAVWPLLFGMYSTSFESGPGFPTVVGLIGFLSGLAHLAGIALLLMAVFAERPPAVFWNAAPPPPGATPAPGGIPPWAGADETDRP